MSKESFKSFARLHPELADQVLKGETSWQQLYEIYEIYGENHSIWNKMIGSNVTSWKELLSSFKNIDLSSVQQGIDNIQKTISYLQDLGLSNDKEEKETRPIYERFS